MWLLGAMLSVSVAQPARCPEPTWQHEVAMVGDIMQHGMQLRASVQSDGTYSWRGVFEQVAPVLRAADLTIGNLETPIAADADPLQPGYSGYPFFNAPEALLEALQGAGFDVLQTANNHCLDRGELGAQATLDALDDYGFIHTGMFRSLEHRHNGVAWTTLPSGASVAMVAYTYGTNGVPMPEGKPWMVNWIRDGSVMADLSAVRAQADLVIVGLHWGREYQHQPEPWQRDMARVLVHAGADVVLGTHPHVLQPAEWVMTAEGRRGLVLYSLGNFVSNQRTPNRDGGTIARVGVSHCEVTGETWLEGLEMTPVWVDTRLDDYSLAFRVLPVPAEEQPCEGPGLSSLDCERMRAFRSHAEDIFEGIPLTNRVGPAERSAGPLRASIFERPTLVHRSYVEERRGAVWPLDYLADVQSE